MSYYFAAFLIGVVIGGTFGFYAGWLELRKMFIKSQPAVRDDTDGG